MEKKVKINNILNLIVNSFNNKEINDNEAIEILSLLLLSQKYISFNYEIEDKINFCQYNINELIDLFKILKLNDKYFTFKEMSIINEISYKSDYNDNKLKIFNKIYNLYIK